MADVNRVKSYLQVTKEQMKYGSTVVATKSTTINSGAKYTSYTSGAASVYIGSYNYSFAGTSPTSVFSSTTGSAAHYQYIDFYFYKDDHTTVGSSLLDKSQTRKPTYSPSSTWDNATQSYTFGYYTLPYGASGEIPTHVSGTTLTVGSTRTYGNYYISITTAAESAAGTKTGYHFYRWACQNSPYNSGLNTDAELTLQTEPSSAPSWTYAAGASWTSSSSSLGTTYKFYPMWVANQYTITYNANGGTGTMAAQTVTYNNNVTLNANTFTRTGYTFSGWKSDTNYDHPDKETFTYQRAGNTVMYAQWTPNTYTISYNANSGSGSMSNTVATYDASVTLRSNSFTRTGYNFNGWNTVSGGSGTSYSNGQTFTYTTVGNTTLYAQWKAGTYTLTFNLVGGTFDNNGNWGSSAGKSGVTATHTVTYNSGSYYATGKATKTGYTFAGWYDAESGGHQVYDATGACTTDGNYWSSAGKGGVWIGTSNLSLYARWTPLVYTITLNKDGGSGGTSTIYLQYGVGYFSNSTCTSPITSITIPSKSNYAFAGYYSSSTMMINPGGSIIASSTVTTSDVTWTAAWLTPSKVNIGGTWKTVSGIQAYVDGEWKTVTSVKIRVGSVWKDFTGWGS